LNATGDRRVDTGESRVDTGESRVDTGESRNATIVQIAYATDTPNEFYFGNVMRE
jgi:hypothetical protein